MNNIIILISFMFVASCGNKPSNIDNLPKCFDSEEVLDGRPAILIIGDSVSVGYTQELRALTDYYQVVHNSCNAMNSDNGVKNIEKWSNRGVKWELCTLNHGLWDINPWSSVPYNRYLNNLKAEIKTLKKHCNEIMFIDTTIVNHSYETTRNNNNVTYYNNGAHQVMNSLGINVCNLNQFSKGQTSNMVDAVHYNEAGYQEIANYLVSCINSYSANVSL